MEKILMVHPEKCIGCGTCELACSFQQEEEFNPSRSRVTVLRWLRESLSIPLTCLQCDDPACEKVCMVGAITKNGKTGLVSVDEDICVGCRLCVSACPFGGMNYDQKKQRVFKCDLCDGDPQCAAFCPTDALEYQPASESLARRKKEIARRFTEIYKEVT